MLAVAAMKRPNEKLVETVAGHFFSGDTKGVCQAGRAESGTVIFGGRGELCFTSDAD